MDLNILKRICHVIRSTHRHTDTTNRYYHYNYSTLISGQVPAEGTPPSHGWEGGAHAGRSAATASFSSVDSALCPTRYRIVRRGSTKTQTLCEQHTGLTARFPIFRRLSDSRIFSRLVKSGFSCASLVTSAMVEMF